MWCPFHSVYEIGLQNKEMRITGLYICYWSLMDPLCQTQSLAYLSKLTERGHRFALMTFEHGAYRLAGHEAVRVRDELACEGIYWYALKYHKRFPLVATAFDCLRGVLTGLWIVLRRRPRIIHSRASIAAVIALVLSRLCGLKFLYDADSRLSEEYADGGRWNRDSLAFRLTAWVERQARDHADSMITLTQRLRDEFLGEHGVKAPIHVIPCCVDLHKFRPDEQARSILRRQLGVGKELLFVYVGKTGPRYQVDEMLYFFKIARAALGRARLLIISGDRPELFHEAAAQADIEPRDYVVRRASHDEVAEWLSAADVALAFIRSAGSERGSSPIKVGEYLASRLPVVITPGVGDYSDLISERRVGVVIPDHNESAYRDAAEQLSMLLQDRDSLRDRCRATAEAAVSLESVGAVRYHAVYERLLGGPASAFEPVEEPQ